MGTIVFRKFTFLFDVLGFLYQTCLSGESGLGLVSCTLKLANDLIAYLCTYINLVTNCAVVYDAEFCVHIGMP